MVCMDITLEEGCKVFNDCKHFCFITLVVFEVVSRGRLGSAPGMPCKADITIFFVVQPTATARSRNEGKLSW
jgi:hypothetical protein